MSEQDKNVQNKQGYERPSERMFRRSRRARAVRRESERKEAKFIRLVFSIAAIATLIVFFIIYFFSGLYAAASETPIHRDIKTTGFEQGTVFWDIAAACLIIAKLVIHQCYKSKGLDMGYSVAVVGATGNVGTEMLEILAGSDLDVSEIFAVASRNSVGRVLSYGEREIKCHDLEQFDFSNIDIVLMSAGGGVSTTWSSKIIAQGAKVVIDNSSAWRMDPDVPLVVPEVNADAVDGFDKKGIIANPNCSTIQMVVALKPLHDHAKIKRVVVSTYQSTSGGGKAAMDELWIQTKGIYVNDTPTPDIFPKQIAFNVIPQIDVFMEGGDTKEEWKMKAETMKILDKSVKVTATCVRVPTFVGHAEAINIEFENEISADEARSILRESPGILVWDKPEDDGGYMTPVESAGEFATYVSRIREDSTQDNTLNLWCVADNLRKGAALNAVQIAEVMANRKLLG